MKEYSYNRRTAAVGKYPVFTKAGQTEAIIKEAKIEKLIRKHYPEAVPGSLEIDRRPGGRPDFSYASFKMKTESGAPLNGSVVLGVEPYPGSGIRVFALISIDG